MTPSDVLREAARRIAEGESEGWLSAIYLAGAPDKVARDAEIIFYSLYRSDIFTFGRFEFGQARRVIALLIAAEWAETEK
jgi:hypothetical protein